MQAGLLLLNPVTWAGSYTRAAVSPTSTATIPGTHPKPATPGSRRRTPLRCMGREIDGGTGLYYVRNRWYDVQLGRFLSEDPIGLAGGMNPYTHAHNKQPRSRCILPGYSDAMESPPWYLDPVALTTGSVGARLGARAAGGRTSPLPQRSRK